jgi:rhodanese-related sulfurtransferase
MATTDALRISPEELQTRIAHREPVMILDVRTEDALNVHPYKIAGAHWVPLASVVEQAHMLPRHSTIVTYCT